MLNETDTRGTIAAPALQVMRDLLARLQKEGIAYCHWKSNEHLRAALLGQTDFDILVDRFATPRLERVLAETGFRRFVAVAGRVYPGLEDYLGLDTATGALVHLHLHYELTLGEKHLKGYRLPWASVVLATRCRDESGAVYVTDPNLELLLLLVRAALKIRSRDRFRALLGRPYLRGGDRKEYDWLRQRVGEDRVLGFAAELLGEEACGAVRAILARGPSLRRLRRLVRLAAPRIEPHRTYGPVAARLRRWVGELRWLRAGLGRRYGRSLTPRRRVSPRGGLLIAFMGADGSGKSTLVDDTVRWLSWKIDARAVYFGSGDGPSSLLRWPLKLALGILLRAGLLHPGDGARSRAQAGPRVARRRSWYARAGRVPWALVLAREKRRTLRRAWRGRNRGTIVVCDRYPQNQVQGFNDGPLLAHWNGHRSVFLRRLARWEGAPYRGAEACAPDLVIKLRVSPPVARQRKPEMSVEEIIRRNRAIADVRFPASTAVLEVDADDALAEVVRKVRRFVWSAL